MKILFIHPFLPYPLTSGGHQALYNGIKAVKEDVDITLVYEAVDNEAHRKAREEFQKQMPNVRLKPLLHQPYTLTKEEIIRGKIRNLYRKIFRIKDRNKWITAHDSSLWWKRTITPTCSEWIEHIYNVSHAEHYDIIQIEMPWRISDIYAMPESSKVIFVHHELGFIRRKLEIENVEDNPYLQVCKRFVDDNELAQLNKYDAVITLSPVDKQKLIDAGVRIPVYSSFAIIDIKKPPVPHSGNGKRLVFVGPEIHAPNIVGIKWFLDKCWNKLLTIDPNYNLDIIGRWTETTQADFIKKYTNIKFLGFVEDLYSVMKDAIMIVPITIGSGIRMKILEACGRGIPFVSTTVGAEGIPIKDGEHCLIADDAERFVENIVRLQDSILCDTLCLSSFEMVKEFFSIAALRKNRLGIYHDLLVE